MLTAQMAKMQAMAEVEANADYQWKECVEEVIKDICKELGFGGKFTTDLVWEKMETIFPNQSTHEPRAMGPLMSKMSKMGIIRKTNTYKDSERVECHARPLQIWSVSIFNI